MRSLSFILGLALVLEASAARSQVTAAPLTGSPLPSTAKDACRADCLGYSPSTRTWLCPRVTGSAGLAVLAQDEFASCSLQLIRERSVLADLVMYVINRWDRERQDLALAYEQVLTIAPPDLAPVTVRELQVGRELPLPNTRHVLRLDPPAQPESTPSSHPSLTLNLLCNRNKQVFRTAAAPVVPGKQAPIPSFRSQPRPATPNVLPVFKSNCHSKDTFRVVFGPDPTQIAVLEISGIYCDDFSSQAYRRQAYVIDLGNACTTSAGDQK